MKCINISNINFMIVGGENVLSPNCEHLGFHFYKIDSLNSSWWVGSSIGGIPPWVIAQISIWGLVIIMGVKYLSLHVTVTMLWFYRARWNIYIKSYYPIVHDIKSQINVCIQSKCLTLMKFVTVASKYTRFQSSHECEFPWS